MRFFKSELKLRKLDVEVAYRIGQPPPENSTYTRPLAVKFFWVSDRNLVWKKMQRHPSARRAAKNKDTGRPPQTVMR